MPVGPCLYSASMVTFDDVARIALALPETEETTSYGNTSWAVTSGGKTKGKGFVWERPLSKKDRKLATWQATASTSTSR